MPSHGPFPRYRFPVKLLFGIIFSMLSGTARDFQEDAQAVLSANDAIEVTGLSHIPARECFFVTLNHYSRPGFLIIWAAIAIAACLPCPSIWVMTRAWTNRSGGLDAARTWLSSYLLPRLAKVYGFIPMPPMPPIPQEQADRAIGIRSLMQAVRSRPGAALCLAPQGQDFPEGLLGAPPPGTGKLMAVLSRTFEEILPVGVFEQDGRLVVHFETPYRLNELVTDMDSDEQIAWRVMRRIALCLPHGMERLYPFPQKEKQDEKTDIGRVVIH